VLGRAIALKPAKLSLPGIAIDVAIASVAIAVVAAPMVVRANEPLDFVNHLWLTWVAGKALVAAGHPAYFINTTTEGVFNPFFAFYGGTLYNLTGAVSELTGHPYLAYVVVTVLAIAAAYVGTLALARQFGLRGLIAHAPALTVITSAYFITNLYGRGAWTEFMAVAALPTLAASAVNLVRSPAWRPWPVLVFVISAVILSGSHNLTLLWSLTIGGGVLVIVWFALGRPRSLPYRRFAMIVGLGVVAGLINSWFLITDIAYAHDVAAGVTNTGAYGAFDSPAFLFDPFRSAPSASAFPAIYVQVPDWFLAWGVVAGAMLLWHREASERLRAVWITAVITVIIVLGLIMGPFWTFAPYPWADTQLPFRLNSYVVFAVAGIVLAAGLALQRAPVYERRLRNLARLRSALIIVTAVSVLLCLWQEVVPSTTVPGYYVNRHVAFVSDTVLPPSWYAGCPYCDISAPIVPTAPAGRTLVINPASVHGNRFAGSVDVPPGLAPIQTNIAGGRYVVKLVGLRWLGRNPQGFAIVARLRNGHGPLHIVIEAADTNALEIGWILSIVAVAAVFVILAYTVMTTWRTARRRRVRPAGLVQGD
jgi:hypothetical protein